MPRQNGLKGSPHTTSKAWRDNYEATFGKKEPKEHRCPRCWSNYTGDVRRDDCPACEGKTRGMADAIRFSNAVVGVGWDFDDANKPDPK